ncbi:MAG: hypothetical protein R3C18_16735 [Planctomycetaceae bacterium]
MAYEVVLNRTGAYRILLESYPAGVYVYVFESESAPGPYRDWLQDGLEMAKRAGTQDFDTTETDWREVPDEYWHGTK